MKYNKSIVYRLYPTEKQKEWFKQTFGCCRKVYNLMLNDWQTSYKETGKTVYTTPAKYKSEYPFLRETDSLALSYEKYNLKRAYTNFFKKTSNFPKFKSAKKDKKSYTTYNSNRTSIRIEGNKIRLPKIGYVKIKVHRQPKTDWKLKSATITMTSDEKFYASVSFELDLIVPTITINPNNAIGLDYKSNGLYINSEGFTASEHRFFRESQAKLAEYQRSLTHKVKDSNHYNALKKQIARLQKHISNQRKDFLHKLSTEIADRYDIICIENLDLKEIAKTYHLGKSTFDNGYGIFIQMLKYKLFERGKVLVVLDKYYPSTKTCSSCGHTHDVALSDRVYHCTECGLEIDRDLNAAINIRNEGVKRYLAA